jgi:molybdopterin-guanine dinucleotide biosynthesis protein B
MQESDLMELPGLDCGDCGYNSCDEMREAIDAGKTSIDDCVVLHAGKTVVLKISGKDVPMGEFVQGFVKSTTLGMLKTLKKADIKEGDVIELKILVTADDTR